MFSHRFLRNASFGFLSLASISTALAYPHRLVRDSVIPVVLCDQISVHGSRRGDRFNAEVREDCDLPRGTRLEGRVIDVREKTDRHAASMDLEFTRMKLPDGAETDIRAVPVALNGANVSSRDGHYEAVKPIRKDSAVIGGAVGGFVIGTLIKKPFEGLFAGTLAGILVAEGQGKEQDLVLKPGTKLGAQLERDVTFDYSRDRNRDGNRDWDDARNDDRDRLHVRIADQDLRYSDDLKPFRQGNTVMVPLDRTADQLNLTVDKADRGRIYVESDAISLRIEQGSEAYRLNGKKGKFNRSVMERNGVIYVPLEAFSLLDAGRVMVDDTDYDPRT
jgi:hypothetical protein